MKKSQNSWHFLPLGQELEIHIGTSSDPSSDSEKRDNLCFYFVYSLIVKDVGLFMFYLEQTDRSFIKDLKKIKSPVIMASTWAGNWSNVKHLLNASYIHGTDSCWAKTQTVRYYPFIQLFYQMFLYQALVGWQVQLFEYINYEIICGLKGQRCSLRFHLCSSSPSGCRRRGVGNGQQWIDEMNKFNWPNISKKMSLASHHNSYSYKNLSQQLHQKSARWRAKVSKT